MGLRVTVEHLLEHITEPSFDKDGMKEMRIHMDHMEKQILLFHESIENVASKWHHRSLPDIEVKEGDKLPLRLVLPVCLDCFVDGFLIGISSIISLKAGIILSFANCLEMSFLGMAYSARLKKCTGSSILVRNIALYGPPMIMFCASGIGAALGIAVEHLPVVFIGLVAFGTVALVYLVCNELIIEAKEAQGNNEKWYISIQIFVGIYLVLMLNHMLSV
jgi:zinc transporter ZupT